MKLPQHPLAWTTGAVALILLAWLAQREPVQLVSAAPVTRGALVLTVLEEGKTRVKQRYIITAPVTGRVQRIELQPGDAVREGQTLVQMEPLTTGLLDARSRVQAQTDVAASTGNLEAARLRIGAAQANHSLGQRELQRLEQLGAAGMATHSQLDQARAQAASASAALSTAQADVLLAEQRLQAARAQLSTEGQGPARSRLQVRAPADGVIMRKLVESASTVNLGQPLLELGDRRALEVEVEVLSTDAVRLAPGGNARVLRWGGEGVLQASISRIEPGGFTKVSALGVEEQRTRVILQLTSSPEQWAALGDAFRVEVEFVLRQASNALRVPSNSLLRVGDAWAVYVVQDGTARLTAVQPGLRTALHTQVLEGLSEGQTVVVQPDDRIRDGARVNAASRSSH